MSIEEDMLALTAELEELRATMNMNRSDEIGFREFVVAGMAQELRELKRALGLKPDDLEDLDNADPLEPVVNEDSGIGFSGTVYVSGNRLTGKNSNASYPWVKVDVAAGTATELAGPPSDPFPPNEEWYEKAQVAGDIHVTRL